MGQIVSDVTTILDYNKSKKEAKSQRQQILSQMATDEATKTNLVKKALAAQRAKYGAGGMSGRSMTEEAVLRRIAGEEAAPYDEKRATNMQKLKSIKATKPNVLKTLLARFDDLVA